MELIFIALAVVLSLCYLADISGYYGLPFLLYVLCWPVCFVFGMFLVQGFDILGMTWL